MMKKRWFCVCSLKELGLDFRDAYEAEVFFILNAMRMLDSRE